MLPMMINRVQVLLIVYRNILGDELLIDFEYHRQHHQ
jgi:hypothetical protein